MSDDNISQDQPSPSRDLSRVCVPNHFSSNYREASCYSLHLFNPPERKKEQKFSLSPGLKSPQSTKGWMSRRAVHIPSLLILKLASTHYTVLSPQEGTRERGRGLQATSLCIFLPVKCLRFIRGMLPLIGETHMSLQIAILSNGKDHCPTLGQALFSLM